MDFIKELDNKILQAKINGNDTITGLLVAKDIYLNIQKEQYDKKKITPIKQVEWEDKPREGFSRTDY